jgi:hypothetical protein
MDQFWAQHTYLLYIGFSGLLTVTCFLLRSYLKVNAKILDRMEKNIDELFERTNELKACYEHIQAQHDTMMSVGGHQKTR